MAEINIKDLIKIIMDHPKYHDNWDKGVPAEQALYINFHNGNSSRLESIVLTAKDGSQLVIDSDSNGIVFGIEIV